MQHPDPALRAAALSYAARGWSVLPLFSVIDGMCGCGDPACKTPGKHPFRALVHQGLHNASRFAAHVDRWWTQHPDCNIGIRTGLASQLVVVDLDDRPHDGRDGSATWRRLVAAHAGGSTPSTVEAITGGGGRHLFFEAPVGSLIVSSKDALGPGVEVKAEGGYVVAPPSRHVSGRDYAWELSSHPDDQALAPLPVWLLALCQTRAPRDPLQPMAPRLAVTMDPLEIAELASALACLPSDDRDEWVQTGLALYHTNDDANGLALWDTWSQTSAKYDQADLHRVWKSFTDRTDGLTIASVYQRAHRAGWQRPSLEALVRATGITLPDVTALVPTAPPPRPAPPSLAPFRPTEVVCTDPLQQALPPLLEQIAQWSLGGAPHPVRGYAVAAALALGSVFCARRYTTDAGNFSSLYLLVVGKSGTGKEHVRKTVEDVLYQSGCSALMGPNKWTSDSAVYSGLLSAPQQIAVLDEFGQFLAGASGASDSATMRDGVLTQLMELYGRLGGRVQSPQYSTLTMTPKQREAAKRSVIDRPALTMVGLTTPAMWYGALKSSRIASGFLNRFCVIEPDAPRGDFALPSLEPVPADVVGWTQALLAPRGDLDHPTRLSEIGDPIRLAIAFESLARFTAFRRDCNAHADKLEKEQLGELPMRAAEQAMRLALIATLARDPAATAIAVPEAEWGIDVARWMLDELVTSVQAHLADSPLASLRNRFVARLREAGERGLSDYELKRLPLVHGSTRRDRDDLMAWVVETRHAEWAMRIPTGAGRPTRVLRILSIHTSETAA